MTRCQWAHVNIATRRRACEKTCRTTRAVWEQAASVPAAAAEEEAMVAAAAEASVLLLSLMRPRLLVIAAAASAAAVLLFSLPRPRQRPPSFPWTRLPCRP